MVSMPSGSLPASLGLSDVFSSLYTNVGFRYNYAIGGLPFLSGASREHPIVRETAPVRKQQLDTTSAPGEQSLEGWWLRSQSSFHGGAGLLYADPVGSEEPIIRFRASRNVLVSTEGEVSLLNAARKAGATPIAGVTDATEFDYGDGTQAAFVVAASAYHVVTASTVYSYTFTASATALSSVTTDGAHVYVSAADGIWSAPIPATAGGAWVWTKEYTISGGTVTSTHMAYVKKRVMLGLGGSIYELVPHPAGAPAALTSPKYTAPETTWAWTGFTETATAIYAVGNNTVRGSIIKLVLATDGSVPTLTSGAVAAQLPSGEVPWSAMGYLGGFVGIGTNKGVRVAVSDEDGDLTYGPLLFETTTPVKGWTARDRFLFCGVTQGVDGDSGVYRIDLSTQVAEMRFAYATDLNYAGDTTTCAAVANIGSSNLLLFCTANETYVEDTTTKAESGYLQTARVRFSTLEPKLYKLVKARGPALTGPLSVTVLDQYDNEAGSYTYPEGQGPGESDVGISSPAEAQDFLSLKFTLARDDVDVSQGAELWGYQLKALPGTLRQRMIQLPLLCYDWEEDILGNKTGGEGTAVSRLLALEDLERTGNTLVLQDFDASTNTTCVIEQVRFQQTAPPDRAKGFGGIVTVTVRTVL